MFSIHAISSRIVENSRGRLPLICAIDFIQLYNGTINGLFFETKMTLIWVMLANRERSFHYWNSVLLDIA